MGTTRDDIKEWFQRGIKQGATHLVVVCDTFDHDDYPVFVHSADEARAKVSRPGEMQRVMQVYNLALPMEPQLNEHRSFNY